MYINEYGEKPVRTSSGSLPWKAIGSFFWKQVIPM
jgi:hypothetical protein